jgi:hypothetical protein
LSSREKTRTIVLDVASKIGKRRLLKGNASSHAGGNLFIKRIRRTANNQPKSWFANLKLFTSPSKVKRPETRRGLASFPKTASRLSSILFFSQRAIIIPGISNQFMPAAIFLQTAVLLAIAFLATPSCAAESACYSTACNWIEQVSGGHAVLQVHAKSNCEFAEKFIYKYPGRTQAERERLCYDLVLIWTHKKCIYFRDYVSSDAYTPCKSWSREMFQQCVNRNDAWFQAAINN